MNLKDIEQVATVAQQAAAPARSTGPRTEKGKFRAALNATKHGLAGRHLLLPGEDGEEYSRRMDAFFVALGPTNDAQAQLVALIGDDLWKLERLGKIEQGIVVGRIEELLALTETSAQARTTANALAALGRALMTWEQQPRPTGRTPELDRRLRIMSDAVDLLGALVGDIPTDMIDTCEELLAEVQRGKGEKGPSEDDLAGFDLAFRVLMSRLMELGDRDEAAQEAMRRAIATVALPDEKELVKLGRYRRMLEDGLQRRLQALDQVRKLTTDRVADEADVEKAKEYRVRLRVVA